jgi:hypothetical protein
VVEVWVVDWLGDLGPGFLAGGVSVAANGLMWRLLLTGVAVVAGVGVVAVSGRGATLGASTARVSVSSFGVQGNGASGVAGVSPDGRFVVFTSAAANLVSGDTNAVSDVFLRDRAAGRTVRVSVGPGGRQANGSSWAVAVSGDGRFVLFMSNATNLTRLADTNHEADVFVRDRALAATYRVSVPPAGGQFNDGWSALTAGGISDNGRWVAFGDCGVLTPAGCGVTGSTFVRDRATATTRRVATGGVLPRGISATGQWLTMARVDDGLNIAGLIVRDRWTGTNTPVSTGTAYGLVETHDAHYIAFSTLDANGNGWDVVRWNRVTKQMQTVIANDTATNQPVGISTDGRYVTFDSTDSSLVASDTNHRMDVFRFDFATSTTVRVDLTASGGQIPQGADRGLLSADGATVFFDSADPTIVADDTNNAPDIFARGPLP